VALSDQDTSAVADGDACIPINVSEYIEFCFARGWTDGLPVLPANSFLVHQMLEAAGLRPETIVAEMPSRKVSVTAEKVAINAVMAGCKPEYMPVVVAVVKALAMPEFGLHHATSALAGPTIMILVNGPIIRTLGMNSTTNVFGPGNRANATIGRALRLILLNCLRYRPGVADRATLGTPGKYSCCIGDALSFLGSIAILGQTPGAIVLAGEHAELLRASGWSKKQIREFVVANTGRTIADLKRAGRLDGEVTPADEKTIHYAMDTPEDLMLMCAGSSIGALSMVLPGFGSSKTAGRSRPIKIEAPGLP
jgi:hypothetical protein